MAAPAGVIARSGRRADRVADLAEALRVAVRQQASAGVPPSGVRLPDGSRLVPTREFAPQVGGVPVPAPRPSVDVRPAPLTPPATVILDDAITPPPVPPRILTPEAVSALERKIRASGIESLTPAELAALENTPSLPNASVALPGDQLVDVTDGLDASAIPITADEIDAPSLTPNQRRTDPLDILADRIRNATTRAEGESLARVRDIQYAVDQLSAEDRARLLEHPSLAAGIESERAVRDPAARAAAIANAQARLDALRELSQTSTTDRAAEQIVRASDARATAAAPRPAPARQATADAFEEAQILAEEALPTSDWGALADAFNALPPERKEAVLARLPGGVTLRPDSVGESAKGGFGFGVRRETDMTAPRPMIEKLLDRSTGEPVFLPNAVSQFAPATTPFEEALAELDRAKRVGTPAEIEQARLNVQTFPVDDAEYQDALTWLARRNDAADTLRKAIIGTDPAVMAAQAEMLNAAVTPAPRPGIAPGSRSIEVATEDLPDRELPTQADVANAVEAERQAALDKRAPLGGLSESRRKEAFGIPEDKDLRGLPFALGGRDRASTPFESRPIGSRLTDTDDADAIAKAVALEAEVQAALDDIQSASGVPEMAAARRRYEAAVQAVDKAWPARIVNSRTGEVKNLPASGEAPKGWAIERGRKAWSDSRINKAGQQETFDNLLVTIVGSRPKAAPRLSRSSPDMSSTARQVVQDEILDTYGSQDASELLPDQPGDDLVELGSRGKPGRLGGAQQKSRVQGALQQLYGGKNPLALTDTNGTALFASAEAAADDLLSKNTLFKPGTPSYDLARERLVGAINDAYGPQSSSQKTAVGKAAAAQEAAGLPAAEPVGPAGDVREGTSIDVDALPTTQGAWPEGVMRQKASGGTDGPRQNAIDLPEPTGTSRRDFSKPPVDDADVASFPSRGQRKPVVPVDDAGVSDNLDASSLDLGEAPAADAAKPAGTTPLEPVSGSGVQAEADKVFKETFEAERKAGASVGAARKKANAARKAHVEKATGTQFDEVSGGTTVEDMTGEGKGKGRRRRKKTEPEVEPTTPTSDEAKKAGKADTPAADTATPSTDGPKPPTPDAPKRSSLVRWLRNLGLGAAGGYAATTALNQFGGRVDLSDLDPSGGGGAGAPTGGGGAVEGGIVVPVGAGASAVDDVAAQEAAIQRALDRLRGSRSSPDSAPYQTLQNYNGWR